MQAFPVSFSLGRDHFGCSATWNLQDYWTPPDVRPAAVYHDVLIAYDEQRRLNNGQPSLWVFVFDKLGVVPADEWSIWAVAWAIRCDLAELVGLTGEVSAIEIDEQLAERGRAALAPWPQVTVINADGANISLRESDVVVASAGTTHPLPAWLRRLSPKGRLVFPMTYRRRRRHASGKASHG